ncbi:hypothetical protein KAR91_43070 [Candidatus Pacearchaeota archaeon]|nr:hypothetical protein [Candidatus Pacearchaeota archaeon]
MRILFLYNNLLDSATLVETSEADGFPVENIQHPFRTKVWRTEGGVAGTASVRVNHITQKAVNCVALINYTWTEAPGTFDLEFDNDPAFGSIDRTEALTWAANPTANGNQGTIIKTFTSQTNQYNRLNVVYSPGAVPTDWDLGRMFLGVCFEPTRDRLAAGVGQVFRDPSYIAATAGGQEHADEVGIYREKIFSFILESQAQWELFQRIFNAVGTVKDFFIAFDYNNEPDEMTWYGRFTEIPRMSRIPPDLFRVNCSFHEAR